MARKASGNATNRPSPADLLPPGLRDSLTMTSESQASEPSEPPLPKGAQGEIDPEVRHRMISEAAYRNYEHRGYVEGYELEDWLQAEAEVDRQLGGPEREPSEDANSLGSPAP
jgi:Protein of unknown function (DUF2934)